MLFEALFAHATQNPNDLAVVDDTGRYTYQQLAAMSAGLAMYLAAQTTRPRVGILLPASAGFVASFYGTLLAGKSVVPINFLLGDKEIAHCIADSGIDTIVTMPLLAGRLKNTPIKVIDITQLPKAPAVMAAPKFPSVSADDLAVLMYTSGTSGLPKGVELTYGNLQGVVDAAIEAAHLEHKHSFLGVIPLFHSFGIVGTLIAPIQLGSTVFYLGRFSPVAAMNAIRDNKITLVFGVPSMFAALARLKSAGPDDLKHVYAAISGGEPLPAALRETVKAKFGIPLLEGYGLTETAAIVGMNTPQASKPGSVGRPLPGTTIHITDDDGKTLPQGQTGEVWVQGPMVMKQYHDLPKETGEALTPDRFFKTGDLGVVDADGFLYITGRKKDMIAVSGEKCYPREIEEILGKHPAVAEAAVLGKKDESRGEVVVAFVVQKDGQTVTADVLRDFARKEGLAQWKVPREIFIVEDLPRSPTGKVLKRDLAQKLAAS